MGAPKKSVQNGEAMVSLQKSTIWDASESSVYGLGVASHVVRRRSLRLVHTDNALTCPLFSRWQMEMIGGGGAQVYYIVTKE